MLIIAYIELVVIVLILFTITISQSIKLNHDNLTKINNTHFFDKYHKKYLKRNDNCYLLMIDLKEFKKINDTYGHNMGDKYLITFAHLAKKNFEKSLVIRRGGDEFLILTSFDHEAIIKRLNDIELEIDENFNNKKLPVSFKFNVGISLVNGIDLKENYEEADHAMYSAKNKNKLYEMYED